MQNDQTNVAPIRSAPAPIEGVGDVTSQERGSGARYNANKPAMELIPADVLGKFYNSGLFQQLGFWQSGGPVGHLIQTIVLLSQASNKSPATLWKECAQVFDYGRKKYSEWNWAKGMAWSIPFACAVRHLLAGIEGEELDPESGLPHTGHIMCNLVMLITYARDFPEGDDRPKQWLVYKDPALTAESTNDSV